MIKVVVSYFNSQLWASSVLTDDYVGMFLNLITMEDNLFLLAPFTLEELIEIVFSIPLDYAPRPNGFSSAFYRTCWDTVKSDLLEAAIAFMNGSPLPTAMRSSTIVLILKVPNVDNFSVFRLINLCQVVYEIISKALAIILSELLPKLISKEQWGFVYERNIHENIALALELCDDLKRNAGNVIL